MMTKRRTGVGLVPALALTVLAAPACEAGSLENREEFQAALSARDGAGEGPGAVAGADPSAMDGSSSDDDPASAGDDTSGMSSGDDDGAAADDPMDPAMDSSGDDAAGAGAGGAGGASGAGGAGDGGDAGDAGAAGEPAMMGEDPAAMGCAEGCELIQMRCATAGCHDAASSLAGLNLAADGLLERITDAPASSGACGGQILLDSADPESSLLLGKVLDPPACGARMPLGVELTDDEIDCIRRWVAMPECGGTP